VKLAGSGLADATIRKIVTSLKAILKHARSRLDVMHHNPAEDLRVEASSRTRLIKAGTDFPTQQEIATIVAAASGIGRPFVLLAVFAGLRASELRGLRWSDNDFTKGTVTVAQRADRYGAIGNPKSATSARTIPLPPIVINALKEWRLATFHPKKDQDLVFGTVTGRPQNHGNLYLRMWQPLLASAGIDKPYTLHSLRHFFCSWLINREEEGGRGLSLKQAQKTR
jgi:integrase